MTSTSYDATAHERTRRTMRVMALWAALAAVAPDAALAQIKAQLAAGITPAWDKGIQPIGRDNYWNAVECGKQGGERPACVFYDADLCKNDGGRFIFDFAAFAPTSDITLELAGSSRKITCLVEKPVLAQLR